MKEYYVYILKCRDGKYYTGVTNDLTKRVQEHQCGLDPKCFTYERRPVNLVFSDAFSQVQDAIAREKQLQGWSRKKKEALIAGDIAELKRLAKSKSARERGTSSPFGSPRVRGVRSG